MAARALASATIAFGLVSIPVKLYSATESTTAVRFNQIHKKDGSRVKQQLISATTGEVVPKEEIVKGYEFAKGQYVLFEPEELKALEADSTQSIDIHEFVPGDQISRVYMEKIYYLGPDKGGARAYHLLSQALTKTSRGALGQYSARGKQYLVVVRATDAGLVMEQLRYADEVRSVSEVKIDHAEVKEDELNLALQLIEQASTDSFEPEKYKDEVRQRVMDLIQRKVDGEDISVTTAEEPEHKIIDMMEALKASIAASDTKPERKPAKQAGKKAASRSRKKSA